MKVKTVVIIILMVLFSLFVFNTTRNCIIINKIIAKQAELKDCTNYSYTRVDSSNKENSVKHELKARYKDGIGVVEVPDGNIVWQNSETKESIFYNTNDKTARISTSDYLVGVIIATNMEYLSWQEKLLMYTCSIITSDTVAGEKCYCLQEIMQGKDYISKETGLSIKTVGAGSVYENGQEYKSIVEIKNFQMNQLTDEDVARPDLSEYTIMGE